MILELSTAEVLRFAVVLFRIGGIMVFAPFFSSRSIPMQVRVAITLVAAVALCPALPISRVPTTAGLTQIVGLVLGETLFGMVLGLVASFVFAGMQLAGQIMSFQLGFSLANLIDPQSGVESTVISFLQYHIALLFFLLIDGHHWFFLAVTQSFDYLTIGGVHLQGPVVEEVLRLSAQVIVFGVQVAGPVLAVTVVTDVVLGIIGRTTPQIGVLIVAMPVKTLVGFLCVSFSFYFLPRLLGAAYATLYHDLFALMRRMG
jgi:flagellar biosynthesis protein FliR